MVLDVLKAILVGICAAAPVGPVLFNVIQKSLCYGRHAGRMCGLGSALADGTYAAIGLLALSMLQGLVEKYTPAIMIGGGLLVGAMGLNMLIKKYEFKFTADENGPKISDTACGVQTFCMAISNPTALAVMMMLLGLFGLGTEDMVAPVWLIMLAVPFGEFLYWFTVTGLITRYVKLKERTLVIISRIAGGLILAFAIFLIIKGIIAL